MRRLIAILLAAAAMAVCAAEPVGTVRVTGAFACEALGRAPNDVALAVYRLPDLARVRNTSWSTGAFSIDLPPGEYRFAFRGVEVAPQTLLASIPDDAAESDLGMVPLRPSVLASCYGRPPPAWQVAEARGVDAGVSLGDFKGRWVLLLFWGFW